MFNNPGTCGEYFLSGPDRAVPVWRHRRAGLQRPQRQTAPSTPGDPGLDGWEVDVYDSSGNFVASQITTRTATSTSQGLARGDLHGRRSAASGLDADGSGRPISSDRHRHRPAPRSPGNDFGNFQNITISGEKFNDLTGDGILDPGDPGLPGWTIDLLDAAGAIVATTVTDANGNYSFTDVGPGTYTVQEELQAGWIQTSPAPPGTYTVTATSGQDRRGLVFGNFQLVTFAGTVYNDLNGDGSIDPGDPGLQGWTVNLLDAAGNLVATTTSAADGTYSFANLGPGHLHRRGGHPDRLVSRPSRSPPGTYTVQAISSSNPSGLDFGNFQLVNVTGEVYNDLNGNGNIDPGEPGLQGWTVNLLDPAGNRWPPPPATPTATTSSTTSSRARSPSRRSCRAAGPRPSRSTPTTTRSRPRAARTRPG